MRKALSTAGCLHRVQCTTDWPHSGTFNTIILQKPSSKLQIKMFQFHEMRIMSNRRRSKFTKSCSDSRVQWSAYPSGYPLSKDVKRIECTAMSRTCHIIDNLCISCPCPYLLTLSDVVWDIKVIAANELQFANANNWITQCKRARIDCGKSHF